MQDLYLDVDKRIESGKLLPNFRYYHKAILINKNLRNLFIHYLKYKRKNSNLPFILHEKVILAIRNLALYGILDSEFKQIIGSRPNLFAQKDEKGKIIQPSEAYLKKQTEYKINKNILSFLSDIVMETIDFVKINDAIAEYYGIEKDEIDAIKDWALKLSLLTIEPNVARSYKYPDFIYAIIDNYKMKVLTCIYAQRHKSEIEWQSLPGCDFTLPEFPNEKEFSKVFDEFGHDEYLELKNDDKFINAFEKEWRRLYSFSDKQFGFKVVPKVNYLHIQRYLKLSSKKVATERNIIFQLANYLAFFSKTKSSLGLQKAYREALVKNYNDMINKRASDALLQKSLGMDKKALKSFLETIVEKAIDDYKPLYLTETYQEVSQEFITGNIHDTADRKKFKIVPLAKFVDDRIMFQTNKRRNEESKQDKSEISIDPAKLSDLSLSGESRGSGKGNPEAKANRENERRSDISKKELRKDKLLIIEDFAELVLKEVSDIRLDGVSKLNFVNRLRYWDKTAILKPRERIGRHKIRFYRREQIEEISRALNQAEMNQEHKIKGFYSLKEARDKVSFRKSINTFRNRIFGLIRAGKLPKDVKRPGGYAFSDSQLDIIAKELN